MLEVCIDSFESALNAIHGGADELEVCSSLPEGGLTPSAGLVKEIVSVVNKIGTGLLVHRACQKLCSCQKLTQKPKVNIMIRCRTGSDFGYTQQEMDTMLADIDIFKQMRIDRFVFGALLDSQTIDKENCTRVISKSLPIPITFHRAFDVTKNPIVSLNNIVELGFDRLLTSGQRGSACDDDGIKLIRSLNTSYGDRIEIMPGAGVTAENAKLFIDLGCKIVHSSCKVVRVLPKMESHLTMGTGDSETIYVTDESIVRKMKQVLTSN